MPLPPSSEESPKAKLLDGKGDGWAKACVPNGVASDRRQTRREATSARLISLQLGSDFFQERIDVLIPDDNLSAPAFASDAQAFEPAFLNQGVHERPRNIEPLSYFSR